MCRILRECGKLIINQRNILLLIIIVFNYFDRLTTFYILKESLEIFLS